MTTSNESVDSDITGLKTKDGSNGNVEQPMAPISPPLPSPRPGEDNMEVDGSEKRTLEDSVESETKKARLDDSENGAITPAPEDSTVPEHDVSEQVEHEHTEQEKADSDASKSAQQINAPSTTNIDETQSTEIEQKSELESLNQPSDVKHETQTPSTSSEQPASAEQPAKPLESSDTIKAEPQSAAPTSITQEPFKVPESLNPPPGVNELAKHQAKFIVSTVRALKRLKDAMPFVNPVDAVKLNIPTYYEIIKNPMDLSTMEKKCQDGEYKSVSQFADDFNQIISNCVTFNGTGSPITAMVRSIETSFKKYMSNMPAYELSASAVKPKKKSLPPVVNNTHKPQRAAAQAASAAVSSLADGSSLSQQGQQPFALHPSGVPTIRRDSTLEGGRPKREIHPPKSRDLPYGDMKPRKKKYVAELKFCGQVIKDMMSKKHESYSFPFLHPVDPVALNCPSYFKIIKTPMDLSTIQEKYNNNQYETADEFEADIRLMFKNCYKFNPDGSPVNIMGHRFEAAFDKKWLEKPVPAPSPPPASESEEEISEEEDIEEILRSNPNIQFLESQIEAMKAQLEKMKKDALREIRDNNKKQTSKKRKRTKSEASSSRRKSSMRRASLTGLTAPETVTYEMKQEMSEMISKLPEKKMLHVVNIIQESMPHLKNSGQDEIELDIDQLDLNTQLKLYNFVVRKDDSRRTSSKPRASSIGTTNASTGGSGIKKKKRKAMTEDEQSRQIEEIQRKIRQFDRVSGGGANDSDDSSSEDENDDNQLGGANMSSDDSSSEEE